MKEWFYWLRWYITGKPPKNWWYYHTKACGTMYRGCSPDCPKDNFEKTGVWKYHLS